MLAVYGQGNVSQGMRLTPSLGTAYGSRLHLIPDPLYPFPTKSDDNFVARGYEGQQGLEQVEGRPGGRAGPG